MPTAASLLLPSPRPESPTRAHRPRGNRRANPTSFTATASHWRTTRRVNGSRDMVGSPSHRARRHTAPVGLHTTRTQLLQKENPTRRLCPHDNDYGDDETVTTASCRPVIHAEAGRRVNGQCPHQHLHRHRGPHRRLGRCRCSPPGITHTATHNTHLHTRNIHTRIHASIHT